MASRIHNRLPFAREGVPFILAALGITLCFIRLNLTVLSILSGLLFLFVLYFFRDPERIHVNSEKSVLTPADGKIVEIKELKEDFIPAIIVDYPLLTNKVSYIQSDNIKGCKLAVNYLVTKGHNKIAFINGHDMAAISSIRLEGYKLSLESNGLTFDQDIVISGNYSEKSGYDAAKKLLEENADFTAIFAASDLMAVGAIKAINEYGLKIPEEIAVIGFDDILLAEYSFPSLTTIRQHKFDLGYKGSKELIRMIEHPDYIPKRKKVDVELVIRKSV